MELVRPSTFSNQIILVDGQGRSGKNLIAVLLSSMKNVEKMRLDSQLDYIPRYFELGKMAPDAARAALLTEMDEKFYYNLIGRDVNFRPSDYSSVWKQGRPWVYVARLFGSEGQQALPKPPKPLPVFQDMTHDGIQFAKLFFDTFGDRLSMIHVLRDPLRNIYEQNKRNFGTRLSVDPLEFQLSFKSNGSAIPLGALGRESEYLNGNPVERLIVIVDNAFRRNLASFRLLPAALKHKILFIDFDDFVVHPDVYLPWIEKIAGSTLGPQSRRVLKRERVPRLSPTDNHTILDSILQETSQHYADLLNCLIADYRKFLGEEKDSFQSAK